MGHGGKAVRAARRTCGASLSAVVLAACNPGAFDGLPRDKSSPAGGDASQHVEQDTMEMDTGVPGVDALRDKVNPAARNLDAASPGAPSAPDAAAADGGTPMLPGMGASDAASMPAPDPGGPLLGTKNGGVVGHSPQSQDDGSV